MKTFLSPAWAFALLWAFSPGFATAEDGVIPEPEVQLEKWYEDHAKGKGPFLDPERKQFWEMMFAEDLQKAVKSGHWGFDPLYFGQDADIKNLKISRIGEKNQAHALVLISFENFGKKVSLIAYLEVTDHGWRLINIVNPEDGASLIRDLGNNE